MTKSFDPNQLRGQPGNSGSWVANENGEPAHLPDIPVQEDMLDEDTCPIYVPVRGGDDADYLEYEDLAGEDPQHIWTVVTGDEDEFCSEEDSDCASDFSACEGHSQTFVEAGIHPPLCQPWIRHRDRPESCRRGWGRSSP